MVCTSCKTSCNVLSHSHVTNKRLDLTVLIGGSGSRRGGGEGGWLLASLHLCCFHISYWLTFTENCLLEARKEENNCHNNCRYQWI